MIWGHEKHIGDILLLLGKRVANCFALHRVTLATLSLRTVFIADGMTAASEEHFCSTSLAHERRERPSVQSWSTNWLDVKRLAHCDRDWRDGSTRQVHFPHVCVQIRGRRLVPGALRMCGATIAKVYLFRFDKNLITNKHITGIPNA